MSNINTNDSQEIKLNKPKQKVQVIAAISEGKRFESYVGWAFAKSLNTEKYILGMKYSFLEEVKRLFDIINK